MSAELLLTIHRIPETATSHEVSAAAVAAAQASYDTIIDACGVSELLTAASRDYAFDVERFGIDNDDFHDAWAWIPGCGLPADWENNTALIEAAAAHLKSVVAAHVVSTWHANRTELKIGGAWYAVYGGTSWGDAPFDGWDGVAALALLPELAVPAEF